jgi:hypothetical protein
LRRKCAHIDLRCPVLKPWSHAYRCALLSGVELCSSKS